MMLVGMTMMILGESLWWGLGVEVSYDNVVACSLLSGGCAIILAAFGGLLCLLAQ